MDRPLHIDDVCAMRNAHQTQARRAWSVVGIGKYVKQSDSFWLLFKFIVYYSDSSFRIQIHYLGFLFIVDDVFNRQYRTVQWLGFKPEGVGPDQNVDLHVCTNLTYSRP
jgi:hypothetical protein